MEIKDIQGNVIVDVPITQSAVKTEELMKQYSIALSWNAISDDELPLGSYIEYEGVRYSLLEPYSPEQRDEATFEYRPVFQHPIMRLSKALFFFYTYSDGAIVSKELDWSLTDNPANFMSAICDALLNELGESWTYEIASDLPASTSLSFSNTDIFSALNSIAGAFETEWWFDYANKVLYLSKAQHGSAVTLEVGQNIGVPQVTPSKEGYYTRFYVFGSTRNIDQSYAGANVNSIVNRRLTLDPTKYPNGYIDIREGLTQEEILPTALVFDNIYPRSYLTISDVKVRLMWRLDDNGKKVPIGTDSEGNEVYDQYAIWYFKIPELTFSKDMLISGKALSVHFNSGPLQGREFELTYHDKTEELSNTDGSDFIVEAGDYEINFIEEGTFIIPAITGLIPIDGNSVTLFNIIMPEEYKSGAYEELEAEALKAIAKKTEDNSNYTFDSNKVAFYENNPNLTIGRVVTFVNGTRSISTRVIKLETQLDYPFEQRITVGNAQIKGTQQTLKEEVVSANQNIDLLAAINESTEAFQQALQRTQKLMQENMAADLFERVNVGTEENPVYSVVPKPYKGAPVGIVSDTFITAGGVGETGSSSGGLIQNVYSYGDLGGTFSNSNLTDTFNAYTINQLYTSGESIKSRIEVLESNMGVINPDTLLSLNNSIASNFNRITSLEDWIENPTAETAYFNELGVRDKLNVSGPATFDERITGIITEAVNLTGTPEIKTNGNAIAVLVGEKTSSYITIPYATKALNDSNGNNIVETYSKKADVSALTTRVTTVEGYFTNGAANNALKLGGQLPAYYATRSALDAHIAVYNTHITEFNNHVSAFNSYKTATDARLEALEALWGKDDTNKGLYPKDGYGIYSESYITAGGIGTSGSDGGSAYDRLDSWDNYDASAGDVLSAVLGYGLKQRIEILESNMGVINPDTLLSLNNSIASNFNRITSLEDWIENPTAETAYFNELGVRDKLNVSGPATFDDSITGVITTAINLQGTPELKISGNTIAALIGEKTSSYITIPYATKALNDNSGRAIVSTYSTKSELEMAIKVLSEGISNVNNAILSIEEQLGNTSFETIIAREIGIEDKLNVAGPATFDNTAVFASKTTHNGGIGATTGVFSSALSAGSLTINGPITTIGALIADSAKITTNIRVGGDGVYNYISTRTAEEYYNLSIDSYGDKICISGQSNTVLNVNYTKTESGWAPKKWNWYNGSSTGWANFELGSITANGSLVAGQAVTDSLETGEITATKLTVNGVGKIAGNLTTTNIIPDADATYNLGQSSQKWYQVHVQDIFANSGRIYGHLRLQPSNANFGSYLHFGDGSYCYIAELSDDKMTIYADAGLQISADTDVSGNIYATGAITAGSDARYKSKLQDVAVDIETIANAPLFNFKWNDGREDNKIYLGTTAQYWNDTAFKNAVIPTTDEKLWTMSYSQIAMGNTIVLARELLPIKRKVSEIDSIRDRLHKAERRIEVLEQELNQYRRA